MRIVNQENPSGQLQAKKKHRFYEKIKKEFASGKNRAEEKTYIRGCEINIKRSRRKGSRSNAGNLNTRIYRRSQALRRGKRERRMLTGKERGNAQCADQEKKSLKGN